MFRNECMANIFVDNSINGLPAFGMAIMRTGNMSSQNQTSLTFQVLSGKYILKGRYFEYSR